MIFDSGIFLGVQEFVGKIIESIAKGTSGLEVEKYGRLSTDNPIMGDNVWSWIGKAFDVVAPIGIALATTIFILNVIDLASKDNATFENFVKLILNVIITIATINMAPQIVNVFISINDSLVGTINGITIDAGEVTDWAITDIGLGIVESLVTIILLFIPWLVGIIADLALYFPLISRCFEVGWRCVFFPLGVCNFTGGAQSPALRYIKSLAGVLLVGAFYIVIIKLQSAFAASVITNLFKVDGIVDFITKIFQVVGDTLLLIIFKFAALGVMMSGSRAMKEVMG